MSLQLKRILIIVAGLVLLGAAFVWSLPEIVRLSVVLALCPFALAAAPKNVRTVVILSPENTEGSPGNVLINRGLRATFAAGSPENIQIRNEYLDLARFEVGADQKFLVDFLRLEYAGQKVDLVMAALASSLDFALTHRQEIFPDVPVVFIAVDQHEVQKRTLPADVIGVPITRPLYHLCSSSCAIQTSGLGPRDAGGRTSAIAPA